MALPYSPHQGEILICNFDDEAVGAEMIKRRPAIVISRKATHWRGLCTVIPISTTQPVPPESWHHPLPHLKILGWEAKDLMWAKCDMIATVSLERLTKPYKKTRHYGRQFVTHQLDDPDLATIVGCVRSYLGV